MTRHTFVSVSEVVLFIVLCFLWFMTLGVLSACSESQAPQVNTQDSSRILMSYPKSSWVTLDSIFVIIDGVEYQELGVSEWRDTLELPLLATGLNQTIYVKAFEESVLRYQGELTLDIEGALEETIELAPVFQLLNIEVPLGLDNPYQVAGGILVIEDLVDSLNMSQFPYGFELGPLDIDSSYIIESYLFNLEGDTLFSLLDTILIQPMGSHFELNLYQTLAVQGSLTLTLLDPQVSQGFVGFENIPRRSPHFKDLIFSELMIQPTSTGSDYEYLELLNTSQDSLELVNCKVSKSRGSTSASSVVPIDSLVLPPQSLYLLGGPSWETVAQVWESFSLTNTRQALLILCDDVLIDSVYYETSSDSLNFKVLEVGKAFELNWDDWESGEDLQSWCTSNNRIDKDSLVLYGSPMDFNQCP